MSFRAERPVLSVIHGSIRISAACGLALAVLAPIGGAAAKSSFQILYSFCSQQNCFDGSEAEQILERNGKLYGTTFDGGNGGGGTVFSLTMEGSETVLYNFDAFNDGGDGPLGRLVADRKGDLFGTTYMGGGAGYNGTLFELPRGGSGSLLHSFAYADGLLPEGALILDSVGNLYGTAPEGGQDVPEYCTSGCGTVFKYSSAGAFSVLYRFCNQVRCADGGNPNPGLVSDKDGNLYGTTGYGGASLKGAVFKLTSEGTETVLYSFKGATDGYNPEWGLLRDSGGNLYGTSQGGGGTCGGGCGTIFKLAPDGTKTILYAFTDRGDGWHPQLGFLDSKTGNLYGVTRLGGKYDDGTVFELSQNGTKTTLHSFTGGTGGKGPLGLVEDASGNLYGVTNLGGASGDGTVYKLTQ